MSRNTLFLTNVMTEEDKKRLSKDPDGLITYEYIANHIGTCISEMDFLVENMALVDRSGQFTASAARYLSAIDKAMYVEHIDKLIALTIEKDREHRYLADLLQGIWGPDYAQNADELSKTDDNFRRIYKRLFPTNLI